MKKALLSIVTVLACGLLSSCGLGTLGTTSTTGTTTGTSTDDILSSIIGTIAGNTASASTIVGTWTYSSPCVQFESESLLAKAGGSVISSKVESQLATYYQKVGIKQGACTFVFGSDNSLKYTIGSKTYTGSYTFDSSKNTVTITTQLGTKVTAYVSISGSQMGLTCDASKLLTLLNTVSSASSNLSSISSIASNYSGMKAGFKFTK